MFDTNLLDILCCPETRGKLKLASDECLAALNQSISAGTLKNVAGENCLSVALLRTKSLGLGLTTVLGGTHSLLMSEEL